MTSLGEAPAVTHPHAVLEALDELLRLDAEDAGELLLVRHARPAPTRAYDPMLSCEGLAEAERLAERLSSTSLDAVYASPERRARQTGRLIAAAAAVELGTLDELTDVRFNPRQACLNGTPEAQAQRFLELPRWDSLPGFEPSREFRRRVIQVIEGVLAAHEPGRVIIVTHSSVINAYLSMLLGVLADQFFAPRHASITTLRWGEGRHALQSLNDTAHLSPVPGDIHNAQFYGALTAVNNPLKQGP